MTPDMNVSRYRSGTSQVGHAITGGGSFGPMTSDLRLFGPGSDGWISEDKYPRHLADVNHDGAADIVGFGQLGVYASLSNGFLI